MKQIVKCTIILCKFNKCDWCQTNPTMDEEGLCLTGAYNDIPCYACHGPTNNSPDGTMVYDRKSEMFFCQSCDKVSLKEWVS